MASLSGTAPRATTEYTERRFFFVMALVMVATVVAGFSLNLAMGRSTFAVPPVYHVHAAVFMGWLGIYVAQSGLIAADNKAMHRRLGVLATAWVPLMIAAGITIMITSLQRSGGPFFFDQNQFLISNTFQLLLFGGFVAAGIKSRRYTGWHRRMMFMAMTVLTGPGLGRLLPMPLFMPQAWHVVMGSVLIFPLIGMIHDWRRTGRVHSAWFWGVGLIVAVQVAADMIAYSPLGVSLTEWVIAGTPGAERPMEAFMPPGLAL